MFVKQNNDNYKRAIVEVSSKRNILISISKAYQSFRIVNNPYLGVRIECMCLVEIGTVNVFSL